MNLFTTKEAAEHLGVTVPRVHALIRAGRLPPEKMGRDYFIKSADLALVADRKVGRPPNAKAAPATKATANGAATKAATKKGGKK